MSKRVSSANCTTFSFPFITMSLLWSHSIWLVSFLMNRAVRMPYPALLFIIKTPYGVKYIKENLMTSVDPLQCLNVTIKMVTEKEYWWFKCILKNDGHGVKLRNPQWAFGRCYLTLNKPFKYTKALRQTSKLMKCLQKDVHTRENRVNEAREQAGDLWVVFRFQRQE